MPTEAARLSCRFRTLVVEVTDGCNNACLHCYNHWLDGGRRARAPGRLSRAEISALVAKAMCDAPIEQVALSGGEPLLRSDLPEIAGDMARLGLATVVITNGTLLDEARLRRFPAGSMFEITLFSADEGVHNRIAGRDVFERVLENLVGLRRAGHHFALACVVTRLNWRGAARAIRLGVALGAEAVLLNRVNLSRRVFDDAPRLAPSAAQLRWGLRAAEDLAARYGVPIAIAVPVPPCVADPRDYPHLHFGWCPRGGRDAYYTIGSTGLLRPCNHSSRVLGDLRRQGFAEIVRGPAARRFWRPVPPECRECRHPLGRRCRGGCPAAADECFGDRARIDPYVELQRTRPGAGASSDGPRPPHGTGA